MRLFTSPRKSSENRRDAPSISVLVLSSLFALFLNDRRMLLNKCHELGCEELKEIVLEILGNVGFGPALHKKPLKMLNSSLSLVMVIPDQ